MTLLGLLTAAAVAASAQAPTSASDLPRVSPDTAPASAPTAAGPVAQPAAATPLRAADDSAQPRPRRRAVEVSDAYATRLAIHRVASYTMPPLFVAEYLLGQKMLNAREDLARGIDNPVGSSTRTAHQVVAGGVAALFAINTVTGVWNLYETRHQEAGRKLRVAHAVLMLASDAGFAATGLVASNARSGSVDDARLHRNVALASMAPATVGAVMMWINQIRNR
ncbi:hypothetical protein [Gemmatirosa kalamazoonensis]|uniref:hypothetical protein n=1 Tax=Gemmatirosa kalamazoonensis TaxID=861299 RepID=UPI00130ECEC7|nr:hypothetical protein [Gemmatirosa kalamazoonensis]